MTRRSRAPSTRLLLTTGPSEAKGWQALGVGSPSATKKMSYSREDVKAVTDKILNMAKADGVEIEFSGGERSATRYANSTITANLTEHDQEVTITVRYGQKAGSTTVHQFDDASLKQAIGEAQTLAKQRPDNPELMPLLSRRRTTSRSTRRCPRR